MAFFSRTSAAASVFFLVVVVMAAAAAAAVVYDVGDASGWTTIGHVDYKKWAASKSIRVGDILRFKYHPEYHNVIQVNYPDYVSCNTSSPLATYTSGNDSITLKKGAHHFFICGVPGHCQRGLKVDIRVLSPSPPPPPPTPPPVQRVAPPAPAPTPTPTVNASPPSHDHHRDVVSHDVGDFAGWTRMGYVDHFYSQWAASQTFYAGDILRFKYNAKYHNVIQVIYSDYVSCNVTTPLAIYTTGNDSITIDKGAGRDYYFICGFPGHCDIEGMKLHIHVSEGKQLHTP